MIRIPKIVKGLGGDIRVVLVDKLKHKGEKVAGLWHSYDRKIEIAANLPLRAKRLTLYHEVVHAALDDSGLHYTLPKASQEVLCDLIATAIVRMEDK